MCNKASTSTIEFAPECYKTWEICVEAVDTFPVLFHSVPDWHKNCAIKLFLMDSVMLKYYLNRYKTLQCRSWV